MDVVFYIEIGGGGDPQGGTAHVGSFGEREHALSFARRIREAGYQPRFVVRPLIAEHLRLAGFEPEIFSSPAMGVAIVRDIQPAMVVGCELFNLSPASVRGLEALGIPLATIDGTSLPFEINTDPFKSPKFARPLVLPERYVSFRPCPVNDAGPDSGDVFHWSLFAGASRVAKDEAHYAKVGLDHTKKTVMLPIAPWAMGAAAIFGLDGYYERLISRVVDGLDAYGEPVDLLFISLFRPPSLTSGSKGAVTIRYEGLVPYDTYDHLLRSCDAIVSDNIIQTSVSKAVVIGTPHLIIQNTGASEMPYPWNMFPVKLMFPEEREYSRIVEIAEYGNTGQIRDTLAGILRDGCHDVIRRDRRLEYLDKLRQLSTPGEILDRLVGPAAVAGVGTGPGASPRDTA